MNPIYVISQSLLYGTNTKLDANIKIKNSYNKVWKFPTYMGMKIGTCNIEGTLSWSDDQGDHQIQIFGTGISWSMRALL